MLAAGSRRSSAGTPSRKGKVANALAGMAEAIRAYLVWRTIVNFGLGLVLGLVYSLLGLTSRGRGRC